MIKKAWGQVKQTKVVRCWIKAGILHPDQVWEQPGKQAIAIKDLLGEDIPVDPAMGTLTEMLDRLRIWGCVSDDVTTADVVES